MRTTHPKLDQIWNEFCDEAKCGDSNYELGGDTFEGSTFIRRVPLINVGVAKVKVFRGEGRPVYEEDCLQADEFPSELNITAETWVPRIPELKARGRPYLGNFYSMWTHENRDSHYVLWSRSNYTNLEEIAWRFSLKVKELKQIPAAFTMQATCHFGKVSPYVVERLDERMKSEFGDSQCEGGAIYCVNLFGD